MSPQRKRTNRVAVLNVAEGHAHRLWLVALTIGTFFFSYYYFAEVLPALLLAGSG